MQPPDQSSPEISPVLDRHNSEAVSVSELSRAIKSTLEDGFERVQVRGEIASLARPNSGHVYCSLVDPIDNTRIQAVCFRGKVSRLSHQPSDGDDVIVSATLTAYGARSQYQLIIDQIRLAGVGALLKMLEERRQKLSAEGLFDIENKKPLPLLPNRVGVVTSEKGAVWQDILHRVQDRCPLPITLWPVTVQGDMATQQICAAIDGMNALPAAQRPDVLIIARGGGSLEDLMPFQQESVIRAVARSTIPLVSAIGHETDTTLIDYAADKRAPTPTAAAEMVVPVRQELLRQIRHQNQTMQQRLDRQIERYILRLRQAKQFMRQVTAVLAPAIQRLDISSLALDRGWQKRLTTRKHQCQLLGQRLHSPRQILRQEQQKLRHLQQKLPMVVPAKIGHTQQKLQGLQRVLRNSSVQSTLERGFVLVQNQDGKVIRNKAATTTQQALTLRFSDGTVKAQTIDIE